MGCKGKVENSLKWLLQPFPTISAFSRLQTVRDYMRIAFCLGGCCRLQCSSYMTTSLVGERGERREERKVERTSGQVGDCQLGSCRATCEASSSASFYSDLLKLILKDANCLTPFVLRAHPFVVPQVLLAAITHNDYVALLLGFSLVMIQLTAQLTNSAGKTTKAKGCRVALTCISLVFSHLLSSDYKSLYLVAASLFASQSCHNFWL